MDHTELNLIDENKPNIIRKKSSFLRDGSYRIFHITKKSKDNNDNQNNIDLIIDNKIQRKSLKISNRNGLKQFFLFHKTSCDSSSTEIKTSLASRHTTNELSPPVFYSNTTSENSLRKTKSDNTIDTSETNHIDEINVYKNLHDRTDKFEQSPSRKQILHSMHPELQASFHRRRKRFIVACGTVTIALSVIITIIVYVIVMTVRYITEINQSTFYRYPRI
ncbi:unnamed protein product [Adineta steineri]|uniref:Uncharacterized protein n=1 Tax=Adineta steineri TaxID=433720 RepID=A0A814TAM1_9BILA|nr:unnamed protein product [Adineta steineri]